MPICSIPLAHGSWLRSCSGGARKAQKAWCFSMALLGRTPTRLHFIHVIHVLRGPRFSSSILHLPEPPWKWTSRPMFLYTAGEEKNKHTMSPKNGCQTTDSMPPAARSGERRRATSAALAIAPCCRVCLRGLAGVHAAPAAGGSPGRIPGLLEDLSR